VGIETFGKSGQQVEGDDHEVLVWLLELSTDGVNLFFFFVTHAAVLALGANVEKLFSVVIYHHPMVIW
jgi:hypothetical protein